MSEKRSLLEVIKNILLYAGVNREDYEAVKPEITRINRIMVIAISGFASVLILAMYISSLFVEGIAINQKVYQIGLIVTFVFFIAATVLTKKYPVFVGTMMTISYSIFYIYGIMIGTISDPKDKTVTFIVMLVFLTVLFVDRPIHMMSITIFYVIVFIVLCYQTKTGEILDNDVLDAIVFGILGISSGTIISHIKVNAFVQTEKAKIASKEIIETNADLAKANAALAIVNAELAESNRMLGETNAKLEEANKKLKSVSRYDALTQIQNRNAYEMDFHTVIKRCCKEALGCIFIDVNGLKRANDTLGHEKGDEMLITVAQKVKEYFGEELTYRLGGDEFVAFIPDPEFFQIKTTTDKMIEEIEAAGYHVAVGWKIHQLEHLSMESLIREAEGFMYRKKAEFYKNAEFDRRQ